jgi:hypothetical protein
MLLLFGIFWLTCMTLETVRFSNCDMAFQEERNLTGNFLHTPNTQSHFNQNTSMLSDCTQSIHALLDSSLLVCMWSNYMHCKSYTCFFSPQHALSSPLKLQLSWVSADQLLSSGNSAFLQSQLIIEHQQRRIGEMKNQIQGLKKDLVEWKTHGVTAEWDFCTTLHKWHIIWLHTEQQLTSSSWAFWNLA